MRLIATDFKTNGGVLSGILLLSLVALSLPVAPAHAQSTSIGFRVVPSSSTLTAGSLLTLNFYLDVNSLAAGDNYSAARLYLAYVQNPSAGAIPATSPFAATPTLTAFTGAGSSSGFAAASLTNPSSSASSGGKSYVGFSLSENAGLGNRTDTGSFLLATATGTLRSDLAPGSYTFSFEEFGSGAARTFVTGSFNGGATTALFPPTLGTSDVTFTIVSGAATPEPPSLALILFVSGTAWAVRRRGGVRRR